jgi:hypothetical protein
MQQHIPFLLVELGDVGGHHDGGLVGLFAGLHGLAAHMADAEGEDAVRLHGVVVLRADEALQHIAVLFDGAVLGDLERGPQAEIAAADLAVGAAQHDVAAEGVLFEEELEGPLQLLRGHLPGHERALGELVGQQGLAHAADDAGGEHGADALHHGVKRQAALLRDELEGMLVEALHPVLAHGEDLGVDGIGVVGGKGDVGHDG